MIQIASAQSECANGHRSVVRSVGIRGQSDRINDVRRDLTAIDRQKPTPEEWFREWKKDNPRASEKEVWSDAKVPFPGVTRQTIRNLRRPPDGSRMKRGRKAGKPE